MIKEEEYEVIGYIQKTCVCDKCMVEMGKQEFVVSCNPPKYAMKCPKCGVIEYIDCDALSGGIQIRKKVEYNESKNRRCTKSNRWLKGTRR
ncbi:MAG: hypothetical protein ACI3T9_03760 [Romboutsia timonensis]